MAKTVKNPHWGRSSKWRKMRVRVYKHHDFTCQGCGWRPSDERIPDDYDGRYTVSGRMKDGDSNYMQMDHIKPRSKGGKNVFSNLQPLCHSCNARKCDG